MKVNNYYWADSDLESIHIEYDRAVLTIWNDHIQKKLLINCSGLAGLTNLCIWDDTIILGVKIHPVTKLENEFVHNLYSIYKKDFDYGGRSLSSGLMELRIELSNHLSFSVYCLEIDIVEQ